MNLNALLAQINLGEDGIRQFKVQIRNAESLASEMTAFANSEGGTIFIGVADDGSIPGLTKRDVKRINQLISNAASQLVRSPLAVKTENVPLKNGRILIVLTVPKGIDKPYFDKNGVIWLKVGADKRRINSKEELRRLFQISDQFHADELPTKVGIDKLDKLRFRDFLRDVYQQNYPDSTADQIQLLQNMNLVTDKEVLNLAGVLMFAEKPEWIKPQFVVKAIRYPGNKIHANKYIDTEDFAGPLGKLFDDCLAFVMRNLHKVQAKRGVNAPGLPEIPQSVFEELLVNALVHRDYLVNAPIRLFIFDNRVEIISPGHLPNNLTVEKIRTGNANIRNPILVSYVAKGLLPYHGLGSGVKRALDAWPDIDFVDDREGCLFIATIHRKSIETGIQVEETPVETRVEKEVQARKVEETPVETRVEKEIQARKVEETPVETRVEKEIQARKAEETPDLILQVLRERPTMSLAEVAKTIGKSVSAVERASAKLVKSGQLKYIGPKKGGHWKVLT